MFETLRKRFIRMTMLAVVAVLSLLMGAINIFNYIGVLRSADQKLAILLENNGEFPDALGGVFPGDEEGAPPQLPDGIREEETPPALSVREADDPEDDEEASGREYADDSVDGEAKEALKNRMPPQSPDGEDVKKDEGQKPFRQEDRQSNGWFFTDEINEETPFNTRFFTVRMTAEGVCSRVTTDRIAAVDEDDAVSYAEALFFRYGSADKKVRGRGRYGFHEGYRFVIGKADGGDGDGDLLLIFLDTSQEIGAFRRFLLVSILVCAAGLLLVYLLVRFFSARIVAPMAESYDKQKQFITDASHELKTPLSVIAANTEVIEMTAGETEWTKSIRRQIRRLSSLIEKLVFLSRMEETQPRLALETLDFSSLVSEMTDSYDAVATAKKKSLTSDIQDGVRLLAEEKSMVQLLSLLLDNAMKYTDEGGQIRVRLSAVGKEAVLSVSNTVEALPEGDLSLLFERFYRPDASRSTKTGGYGIGLSVARAIVTAHKGHIAAEAAGEKEICFSVRLPLL